MLESVIHACVFIDACGVSSTEWFDHPQLSKIQYGGDSVKLSSVDLSGFIPADHASRFEGAGEKKSGPGYMTYEGSMTQPGENWWSNRIRGHP